MDYYEDGVVYLKNRKITIHYIFFKIRNLNNSGAFTKYRYTQIASEEGKSRKVREWKAIQNEKNFLKKLCIIYYTKNGKQNILM